MLELICKELGVEIDEHWRGNDGKIYVIDEVGQLHYYNGDSKKVGYVNANELIPKLIIGELKPKWKPNYGEEYQTPQLDSHLKFSSHLWQDHERDYLLMRRGLVFKTAEEAIDCAINMIELAKHGI